MDTKFQTSFIPKKPMMQQDAKIGSSVSIFLVISIIIFLISLALGGWVFWQKNLLIENIKAEQNIIKENKEGLKSDSVTVESIVELNSRIEVSSGLLNKHVAIYPLFDFFKNVTLRNVRFTNFSFSGSSKDSFGQSKVGVSMSGQAKDWKTVASQADEFGRADWKNIIKEPKISGLNLNQDGSVSFVFSAFISPDYISYDNELNSN
ncbi:MAG: hypothetical protein WCG60_00590 [bacterium]|jgi:hypothetical protein